MIRVMVARQPPVLPRTVVAAAQVVRRRPTNKALPRHIDKGDGMKIPSPFLVCLLVVISFALASHLFVFVCVEKDVTKQSEPGSSKMNKQTTLLLSW